MEAPNDGAEGMGFGEGMSTLPMRVGSGEGAVPPRQKFFFNFLTRNGAFWRLF